MGKKPLIGAAVAVIIATAAYAADIKISALPSASSPLSGTDVTVLNQGATTKQATVAQFLQSSIAAIFGQTLVTLTAARTVGGVSAALQAANHVSVQRYTNDTVGARWFFGKSRNTSEGSFGTVVSDGDDIGDLQFYGADGSTSAIAAQIKVQVDGTPGAGDMPGRIVFSTTRDGASAVTEAARIKSGGLFQLGWEAKVGSYSAGDTTPTVLGISYLYIANSGATTITNFDDGVVGQVIVLEFADSNTTINRSNAYLSGGTNFTSTAHDILILMKGNDGLWTELSRSVNS